MGSLPTPRMGVTGASIAGIFHVSGGSVQSSSVPSISQSIIIILQQIFHCLSSIFHWWNSLYLWVVRYHHDIISGKIRWANNSHTTDSVLSWDPVSETWDSAGRLETPRLMHSMTEVPLSVVEHFCWNLLWSNVSEFMAEVSLKAKRSLSQRLNIRWFSVSFSFVVNSEQRAWGELVHCTDKISPSLSAKGALCWEPLERILVTIVKNGRQPYQTLSPRFFYSTQSTSTNTNTFGRLLDSDRRRRCNVTTDIFCSVWIVQTRRSGKGEADADTIVFDATEIGLLTEHPSICLRWGRC